MITRRSLFATPLIGFARNTKESSEELAEQLYNKFRGYYDEGVLNKPRDAWFANSFEERFDPIKVKEAFSDNFEYKDYLGDFHKPYSIRIGSDYDTIPCDETRYDSNGVAYRTTAKFRKNENLTFSLTWQIYRHNGMQRNGYSMEVSCDNRYNKDNILDICRIIKNKFMKIGVGIEVYV